MKTLTTLISGVVLLVFTGCCKTKHSAITAPDPNQIMYGHYTGSMAYADTTFEIDLRVEKETPYLTIEHLYTFFVSTDSLSDPYIKFSIIPSDSGQHTSFKGSIFEGWRAGDTITGNYIGVHPYAHVPWCWRVVKEN